MTVAVFGDLADLASGHLDAAAQSGGDLRRAPRVAAAAAVGRVAAILADYLADSTPIDVIEAVTRNDLDEQTRAAIGAREGLRMAAASLGGPGPAADRTSPGETGPVAIHLKAAAMSLAAGRDLLRTHFTTDTDGMPVERSDWASVITSAPVTGALLGKVDGWSRQLAFLIARLSLATPADAAISAAVRQNVASGCHWLMTASAALTPGLHALPATRAAAHLLEAIPVNVTLPRQPPRETESVAELAGGVARTAARLRMIAWATDRQAAWSPAMTAASWRWTATGTAVICHTSELIVRALAGHPSLGATLPGVRAELRAAADSAARAWNTWRAVAAAWATITTETTGLTAAGITDSGDLVIRLGRLAFQDPRWAPGRARSAPLRHATDFAPDAAQFTAVLDAVHRAVDALVARQS